MKLFHTVRRSPDPSMGSKTGKRNRSGAVIASAVILAAAAALAVRIRRSGFAWAEFWDTFLRLDWRWMTGAVVFILLSYVGRAARWAVMIRPVRPRPNLPGLVSATVIGFTAVVLFGRPGELVRPYLIAMKEKLPLSSQLAAWLLERVYDLVILLLLFGFALTQVDPTAGSPGRALEWVLRAGGWVVAAACLACLILLLLVHRYTDWVRKRLLDALAFLPERTYERIAGAVTGFLDGMRSARSWTFVLALTGWTVLEWGLIAASFACVFKAVPYTAGLSAVDTLIFLGFVAFGSVVQVPGLGGGMQVAAVVVLTELFGMDLEQASGIAVLIWAVSFLLVTPIGLVLAFYEGVNWRKLRHLEEVSTP